MRRRQVLDERRQARSDHAGDDRGQDRVGRGRLRHDRRPVLHARLGRAVDTLRRVGQELRVAVNELRLGEERNEPLPRLAESMVE